MKDCRSWSHMSTKTTHRKYFKNFSHSVYKQRTEGKTNKIDNNNDNNDNNNNNNNNNNDNNNNSNNNSNNNNKKLERQLQNFLCYTKCSKQ